MQLENLKEWTKFFSSLSLLILLIILVIFVSIGLYNNNRDLNGYCDKNILVNIDRLSQENDAIKLQIADSATALQEQHIVLNDNLNKIAFKCDYNLEVK